MYIYVYIYIYIYIYACIYIYIYIYIYIVKIQNSETIYRTKLYTYKKKTFPTNINTHIYWHNDQKNIHTHPHTYTDTMT